MLIYLFMMIYGGCFIYHQWSDWCFLDATSTWMHVLVPFCLGYITTTWFNHSCYCPAVLYDKRQLQHSNLLLHYWWPQTLIWDQLAHVFHLSNWFDSAHMIARFTPWWDRPLKKWCGKADFHQSLLEDNLQMTTFALDSFIINTTIGHLLHIFSPNHYVLMDSLSLLFFMSCQDLYQEFAFLYDLGQFILAWSRQGHM